MTTEELKRTTRTAFERLFNEGDLDLVDETLAPGAVDHQEPEGTEFGPHLKHVVRTLRRAFPDLHFEVEELVAEGALVASRSTMTGTHRGPLQMGPLAGLPVTGARVEVPHMHLFRYDAQGRLTDLWHVWNTIELARQLGAPAPDLSIASTA